MLIHEINAGDQIPQHIYEIIAPDDPRCTRSIQTPRQGLEICVILQIRPNLIGQTTKSLLLG